MQIKIGRGEQIHRCYSLENTYRGATLMPKIKQEINQTLTGANIQRTLANFFPIL